MLLLKEVCLYYIIFFNLISLLPIKPIPLQTDAHWWIEDLGKVRGWGWGWDPVEGKRNNVSLEE